MSTIEEIEIAAERLAPSEFARLATWVGTRNHKLWTQQMEHDATAGRLDFLFDEAEDERKSSALRDWPEK